MRILIIEDNPKLATGVQKGLQNQGYAADIAYSGFEGEDLAVTAPYDAILLDVMLPDRDGREICRNLRRRGVNSRIIMLTALGATEDKITGLDCGADDYVTKPFEFDELLARLRAVLRRGQAPDSRVLTCDDLELDLYSRRARRSGREWELSNREFSLLEFLMRNRDRVVSRSQIGEKVWDMNFEPASNVIDAYICSLRKKIDHSSERPLIHTVKNAGYRFGLADQSAKSRPDAPAAAPGGDARADAPQVEQPRHGKSSVVVP